VRADGDVPRIFMASLPSELPDAIPAQRKIMFIETTLPLILQVNEQIAQDRQLIADLRGRLAAGDRLSAGDKTWLDHEAALYGLDRFDPDHPDMDELMRRIDIIPPSLALAQSAEESGWGTSRFAQHGNALFGQRIWHGENGLVPRQRDGERFRVASFDRLIDAVRSYALNLDSHPAYEEFRRARAAQRRENALDGFALAGTLAAYSERGVAYVDAIRAIIHANALDVFDHARLDDPVMTAGNGLPDA
jgi:Bax protein